MSEESALDAWMDQGSASRAVPTECTSLYQDSGPYGDPVLRCQREEGHPGLHQHLATLWSTRHAENPEALALRKIIEAHEEIRFGLCSVDREKFPCQTVRLAQEAYS